MGSELNRSLRETVRQLSGWSAFRPLKPTVGEASAGVIVSYNHILFDQDILVVCFSPQDGERVYGKYATVFRRFQNNKKHMRARR